MSATIAVVAYRDGVVSQRADEVCIEEPLEIRLAAGGETTRVAMTMRTPGHDLELAAGFVLGEGIASGIEAIRGVRHCEDRDLSPDERGNVVTVALDAPVRSSLVLERHFTMTSACGVCGSAGIEALRARPLRALDPDLRVDAAVLGALPARMRDRQRVFAATGGLHAAAIFSHDGRLIAVREDVGRHNAVDKIVGFCALNRIDTATTILAVSGRCGYEIAQKAIAAGIPVVASVSAPSSLAVSLARAFGLTLVGFVRGERWNAYAGEARIATSEVVATS